MALTRRDLLKKGAVAGAGLLVAGNLEQLFAAAPASRTCSSTGSSVGPVTRWPAAAGPRPGIADGMATFLARNGGGTVMVRNQELGSSSSLPVLAGP